MSLAEDEVKFIMEIVKEAVRPLADSIEEIKDLIRQMSGGTQAFREWRAGHDASHDRIITRLDNHGFEIGKIKDRCDQRQKDVMDEPNQKRIKFKDRVQTALLVLAFVTASASVLTGIFYAFHWLYELYKGSLK